jgi:hypothetical protein
MKKIYSEFFAVLTIVLCATFNANAQIPDEDANLSMGFYKAAQLGLGGAWRALAEGTGAIETAPSGLSFKKTTGASFDYSTSGYLSTRILSGSVYDSKSIGVAAGLTYNRYDFSISGRGTSVNQFIAAIAKDVYDKYSLGGSLKYISISRPYSLGGTLTTVTGDLSVTARPIKQIYFTTVLQNIYTGKRYAEVPFLWGTGMGVVIENKAKFSIDTERNFSTKTGSKMNYYFGGEASIATGVVFRSGFGLDRVRDNPFFGVGLGFIGPKLTLDFTFSERLKPVEQSYALSVQVAI